MSDALENLAKQGDELVAPPADPAAPGAPGEPGAVAAPQISPNHGALVFLLSGFRELACLVLKVESPRRTLDEKNVEACAGALAPVADKYGLNLATFLDGPEGMAIVVAGPILWGTYREMDAELRARRAKKVEGEEAPAAAPAAAPAPAGDA